MTSLPEPGEAPEHAVAGSEVSSSVPDRQAADAAGPQPAAVPYRTLVQKLAHAAADPVAVLSWRIRRVTRRLRILLRWVRQLRRLLRTRLRSVRRAVRRGVRRSKRLERALLWLLRRHGRRLGRLGRHGWLGGRRSAWGLRQEGFVYYGKRDYGLAADALRSAVAIDPQSSSAWLGLARAERALARTEDARRAAKQALLLAPSSEAAVWLSADLAAKQGDGQYLRELLADRRERERDRLSPDDLRRACPLALRAGDAELALELTESLLASHPEDEEGLLTRALACKSLHDRAPADELAARAARSTSSSVLRAAARMHSALGEVDAACAALGRLDDDAGLLLLVAQKCYDKGHLSLALSLLVRAATADPGHSLVALWVDRVQQELDVLRGHWPWSPPPRATVPATPRRILHVVGRALPEVQVGYTIRTRSVVEAQLEVGLDPHVVTGLGFPPGAVPASPHDHQQLHGVPHHRLLDDLPEPRGLAERLTRSFDQALPLVREIRPAVLQPASDYLNARVALALRESTGIPVVYEARGFWEESWLSRRDERTSGSSDQYLLRRAAETDCMQQADHVVTLAEVMKADIVSRGIPESKVSVVPNAVDTEAFVPVGRDESLAAALGIQAHEVVAGYISSLVPYEGVTYLIRAVAELAAEMPHLRLLIVGDGPERGRLQDEAARLLPPGRALFTGRVPHDDVLRYYGLIDIFVVPRTNDRVAQLVTPLKPYEAMAAGRAVVVSSVAALLEMVEPDISGLIFEAESPSSLAAVIASLVDDEAGRAELGRSAREWVVANRTWRRNGQRYLDLYTALGAV